MPGLAFYVLLLSSWPTDSLRAEEDLDEEGLHAGMVRAHSFDHAKQLAAIGILAPPLAPNVNRKSAEIYDNVARIKALLRDSRSHNDIYAALLESMIRKRGGTPGTFEENRQTQSAYVKRLYSSLFCSAPETKPSVMFVMGGTAVGKSTFVRNQGVPANTIHINADDIRSLLVGNYATYSLMTGNGQDSSLMRFDASDFGAKDTNKIRFWVQDQVLEKKCNFLADSYSAPARAVHAFVDAGYQTRVFFLEVGFQGTKYEGQAPDFEKKVDISRERIRHRIASGGHASSSSDLMPDGFIKDLRLKITQLAFELKIPIDFFISENGQYHQVAWSQSMSADYCKECPFLVQA